MLLLSAPPSTDNGGEIQHPLLGTPADGIPVKSAQYRWLAGGLPSFDKSVTLSCVFILVQLNKCVIVCGSVLQRGHNYEH